ncbi:hypothetical protein C9374_010516 [Naegleria lovaniensis]|uniref:Uncharacterized protein n=1 Tax=Naegleria lovaniensis TaxID=51637 RepID=A0AA88GFR5_NAELO|nr:uncharacterized protein C9374_010516 [Naegleria lovaniensis]KAG2374772.1 hypothetical protein C9374_010516 [Naegleria lovaniensis]
MESRITSFSHLPSTAPTQQQTISTPTTTPWIPNTLSSSVEDHHHLVHSSFNFQHDPTWSSRNPNIPSIHSNVTTPSLPALQLGLHQGVNASSYGMFEIHQQQQHVLSSSPPHHQHAVYNTPPRNFSPFTTQLLESPHEAAAFATHNNHLMTTSTNSSRKALPNYLEPQVSFGSDPSSIFDTYNSGVRWLARGVRKNADVTRMGTAGSPVLVQNSSINTILYKERTSSFSINLVGDNHCQSATHASSSSHQHDPLAIATSHASSSVYETTSNTRMHEMQRVDSHNSTIMTTPTAPCVLHLDHINNNSSDSHHAVLSTMHLSRTESASTIATTCMNSNMHAAHDSSMTKSPPVLQSHAFCSNTHASKTTATPPPSSQSSPSKGGHASMHVTNIHKRRSSVSSSRASTGKRISNASLISENPSLTTCSSNASNVTTLSDSGIGTFNNSGLISLVGEEYAALQDSDLDDILMEDEDHDIRSEKHMHGVDHEEEDGIAQSSSFDVNTGEDATVMRCSPFTKITTSDSGQVQINHGTWSKEEHELFMKGLREVGRNWELIANKYIKSRVRSQVASHAQKYFKKIEKQRKMKLQKLQEAANPSFVWSYYDGSGKIVASTTSTLRGTTQTTGSSNSGSNTSNSQKR